MCPVRLTGIQVFLIMSELADASRMCECVCVCVCVCVRARACAWWRCDPMVLTAGNVDVGVAVLFHSHWTKIKSILRWCPMCPIYTHPENKPFPMFAATLVGVCWLVVLGRICDQRLGSQG